MRRPSLGAVFVSVAALSLAATPPKVLEIQGVALSQSEDGVALGPSSYFVSGETIFLSFHIAGYQPAGEDEQSIKLNWHVEAKDPTGLLLIEAADGKIEVGLAQEDRKWLPKVRHSIPVPSFAPSGVYHISILVKDEIAKTEARKDAEFHVQGEDIEPAPSLVIRKFHFFRGEEDKAALETAAYRPGDSVWIRFEMVGFKLGEQNRYEVGYGISVRKPDGSVTYEQPEGPVERDQSFYPRRMVPASLSLTLPKDIQTGQYTVILTAMDKVGEQKTEARQTFTVER